MRMKKAAEAFGMGLALAAVLAAAFLLAPRHGLIAPG